MEKLRFVVPINDMEVYQSCFMSGRVNGCEILPLLNENREPIPKLYNTVLDSINDPCWLVFCHQDFVLLEDLEQKLRAKNKRTIYGPIGVKSIDDEARFYGQIVQTDGSLLGLEVDNEVVDTLDELCLMVHSDIIRERALRFDERFAFHFYGADFCLQAKEKGFQSKTLLVTCGHKSRTLIGDVRSPEYLRSRKAFQEKWASKLPVRTTTTFVSFKLNVGCGSNPDADIDLILPTPRQPDRNKKLARLRKPDICADIYRLPFRDGSFVDSDACYVINHPRDFSLLIREMFRITRRKLRLVLGFSARVSGDNEYAQFHWKEKWLEKTLKDLPSSKVTYKVVRYRAEAHLTPLLKRVPKRLRLLAPSIIRRSLALVSPSLAETDITIRKI